MADPSTVQATASALQAANDSGLTNPTGLVGLVTAVPLVGFWLYRQIIRMKSRDGVELTKDRAETDVVKLLQEENVKVRSENDRIKDRLDKISEERNLAVQQLGKFTAEAEMNRQKIGELQTSVFTMTTKLEEQTKLLHEVLLENAQLRSQISHLDYLNTKLEKELSEMSQAIRRLESK